MLLFRKIAIVADIGRNCALRSTTFVDISMSATSRNLLRILSESLNFLIFVKIAKLHATVSGCRDRKSDTVLLAELKLLHSVSCTSLVSAYAAKGSATKPDIDSETSLSWRI